MTGDDDDVGVGGTFDDAGGDGPRGDAELEECALAPCRVGDVEVGPDGENPETGPSNDKCGGG